MSLNGNQKVFLEIVKAGLWEKDVRLSSYGKIDLDARGTGQWHQLIKQL